MRDRTLRRRDRSFGTASLAAAVWLGLGLASAAAAEMALPASFDVGPTGSATYTIPIEVPPGTAGMAPALTLQYDSSAGNGMLGMGWSLGGLPSIARCPRTMAQDGVRGGITFTGTDRFCLNGQRLIALNGPDGGDNVQYQTEIDSFTKVVSHGVAGTGPAWFELRTKSGQIMQLGNTLDSRVIPAGLSTARAWMVNQVADTVGNYLSVTYGVDGPNGQVYPSYILYTGNSAGLQPYNSVQFSYTDARADMTPAYLDGTLILTTNLLTNIKTYAGTMLVSDYQLTYQTPAGVPVSQLASVRRCADDEPICLPPTSFTWSPSNVDATGFSILGTTLPDGLNFGSPVTWTPITGDFNGDGKMDYLLISGTQRYVFLSNGDGTFQPIGATLSGGLNFGSPIAGWTPITGDFNADGLTDYMLVSSTIQYVFLSNGDGTFQQLGSTIPGGANFGSPTTAWTPLVGDFNGDGRTDYMMISATIQYVFLSNGDGTFQAIGTTLANGVNFGAPPTAGWIPITGDFNGDGLTDYVMISGTLQYVNLSNGDGTFQQTGTTLPGGLNFGSPIAGWLPILGDFNGDGLVDFMMISPTLRFLFTSNGDGTFQIAGTTLPNGLNLGSPVTNWQPIVGDFNGDGKADYMLISANLRYVFVSNGDGSFAQSGVTIPSAPSYGTPITLWTPIVGDFGGDGKTDYALIAGATQYVFLTDSVSGQNPFSRLTSITTGLSATIDVAYSPLTWSGFYTRYCCQAYPTVDTEPALYVAQSVATSNGIGGSYSVTYDYGGARADLSGRGFLGFAWMSVTDQQTGIVQTTSYNQSYPTTGLAAARTKTLGALALNSTSFSYNPASEGGTRYAVNLAQSVEGSADLNGATLPTVTTSYQYDGYGDPTQIVVSTSDGATKTTNNSYLAPDTTNWILGRLATAQVTSCLPGGACQVPCAPSALCSTRSSSFAYDPASGLLTDEYIEPGSGNALGVLTRHTQYGHDAYGNKTSVTVTGSGMAARGTSYTYDNLHQFRVTATNALNQTARYQHDPRFGGTTQIIDVNGLTATASFDGLGRPQSQTAPDGTQTSWSYTLCPAAGCIAAGNGYMITATTVNATSRAQLAPTKYAFFDSLAREILDQVQGYDAPGQPGTTINSKYVQYNALGRVASSSRPFFANGTPINTTFSYDSLSRVTQATLPDGSYAETGYSGLTIGTSSFAANGTLLRSRYATKNAQGLVATATDSASQVMSYSYDPFGNLIQTTDVAGNVATMTYDLRGRKTAMTDPDLGRWSYAYDALDELVSQTDAKGQTVTMSYDVLGRMFQRTEPDLVSSWTYDTAANGVGKLAVASATGAATTSNFYQRAYTYDSLTRPIQVATTIDQPTPYTLAYGYDMSGRPSTVTYPNGLVVQNAYTARGYLQNVSNPATGVVYWAANVVDAEGRVTLETLGQNPGASYNGMATARSYDPNTGRLLAIQTGNGNAIQNLAYGWDVLGNLLERDDLNQTAAGASYMKESFAYDLLDRLTGVTFNDGTAPKSYAYDAMGNFTSKSDVGSYLYPTPGAEAVGPHAVSAITGTVNGVTNPSFSYDANGNLVSGAGRTVTYTSFNMPTAITLAPSTLSYTYDSEHARTMEVGPNGTTVYLNPRMDTGIHVEKQITTAGVNWQNYIYAGGRTVAIQFDQSLTGNGVFTRYLHKDHLGSTQTITDESGNQTEYLSYDSYGKRRFPNGSDDTLNTIASATRYGFTQQEDLVEVGLIHMNGRVYDPLVGRFMTADPMIASAFDSQAFDRYAYLGNNPLNGTDPSGFCKGLFNCIFAPLLPSKVFNTIIHSQIFQEANVIAAAASCNVYAALCAAAVSAINAGINGGSFTQALESAAITGATVQAFAEVADVTGFSPDDLAQAGYNGPGGAWAYAQANPGMFAALVAGGAAVGCVSAVASSGSGCAAGALSGGIGNASGPIFAGWNQVAGVFATATLGGFASIAGGGKFANGAVTAGFAYLASSGSEEAGGNDATESSGASGAVSGAGAGIGAGGAAGAAGAGSCGVCASISKFVAGVFDDLNYAFSTDSSALGRNLEDAGYDRLQGEDAHHIVAATALLADPARQVLGSVGMNINDPNNGVFLDSGYHQSLHTNLYYTTVNNIMQGAVMYGDAAARLGGIRYMLLTRTFPH
jgi:RHS repeat-associated protein